MLFGTGTGFDPRKVPNVEAVILNILTIILQRKQAKHPASSIGPGLRNRQAGRRVASIHRSIMETRKIQSTASLTSTSREVFDECTDAPARTSVSQLLAILHSDQRWKLRSASTIIPCHLHPLTACGSRDYGILVPLSSPVNRFTSICSA